jgi:hypothetical protein
MAEAKGEREVRLILHRDTDNGICTLGTMSVNGVLLQTLERPWIGGPPGGTKGVSCVPPGLYRLVRHDTEAHPRSFALVNEELGVYHYAAPPGQQGRTACLIHVANWPSELRGCCALGMDRGENSIARSKIAVDTFYAAVPWLDDTHTLEIRGIA